MEIYCKDEYYSFKELMMRAYAIVFKDEKVGFTAKDANVLKLFIGALDILNQNLEHEIIKEFEEE